MCRVNRYLWLPLVRERYLLVPDITLAEPPSAPVVSYLFRTMGQVLGVALSSTLTQVLLARNLRQRIIGDGAEEVGFR